MTPYYEDSLVTLYHGDCRDHARGSLVDVVIADPPYGETSLQWDRWPEGWVDHALEWSDQMWCFGSMRMFLDRRDDWTILRWNFAQEVVWEKHNGSGFLVDRFRRVHEMATHWYWGRWDSLYHRVQTTPDATARTVRKKGKPPQWHGATGDTIYRSIDGGPRLMRSVIRCRSEHGRALHPTQKPLGILTPLIEYSCPPGGTVLEPFAGAGSAMVAAKMTGRKAIGYEIDERYCEIAAKRLAQGSLFEVQP